MLYMPKKRRAGIANTILIIISAVLFGGGLYLLSLVAAPTLLPYIEKNAIDATKLESPKVGVNRVIIPKINVDIAYGEGQAALDRGAQWRYPDRGNPETGGNFIIAAHRFSLAATPQATLVQSPFYHIDKLVKDDEIIVDYNGKRYGYKVDKIYDVKPTQVEIEAPSENAKMTLYTCSLGGASDGRVVIEARPLGEVTIQPSQSSTTS